MKENKGITLVALIITIIVLLILAVVTISAVNEGSLFSHANNAATTYSQKAEEENTILAGYLSKLKEHDGGSSIENIEGKIYYLLGGGRNNYILLADDGTFEIDIPAFEDEYEGTYIINNNTVILNYDGEEEIVIIDNITDSNENIINQVLYFEPLLFTLNEEGLGAKSGLSGTYVNSGSSNSTVTLVLQNDGTGQYVEREAPIKYWYTEATGELYITITDGNASLPVKINYDKVNDKFVWMNEEFTKQVEP